MIVKTLIRTARTCTFMLRFPSCWDSLHNQGVQSKSAVSSMEIQSGKGIDSYWWHPGSRGFCIKSRDLEDMNIQIG